MSNTIVLLANAYEEYDKKIRKRIGINRRSSSQNQTSRNSSNKIYDYMRENKFLFFTLLILVMSTLVYIRFVLFLKQPIGAIISVFGYAISMFLLIYLSEKDDIKKYNYRRRKYYKMTDLGKETYQTKKKEWFFIKEVMGSFLGKEI